MTNPFIWLILTALEFYMYAVILNVILSWLVAFNVVNVSNRFVYLVGDFLHRITEPALRPIRRYLPKLGGLDISPLVLIVLLLFAQRFVLWGNYQLG